MKAEDRQTRRENVGEFELRVVSYRLGETYYCTVDNVSPGAVLARGQGRTRQEAEGPAVEKARERIGRTRTYDTDG